MRFGTSAGRLVLVEGDGGGGRMLDVASASDGRFGPDVLTALAAWPEFRSWAESVDWAAGAVPLGPLDAPVPCPRQVFAVALNYRPHAAEAGYTPPEAPLLFTKFPSCIAGPDTIVDLPEGHVDWELELVAVVGTGGFRIPRGAGWDAIAGLTVGQDLSERVLQLTGTPPQFSLAKSHPGFGPTGPVVVSADELPDPDDLEIECLLDGERMQHARTSDMIFPVDELVHRISAVCPLLPGDLIFTGTPAGVGNRREPQRFLRAGEALVSRIEGVGELRQTFR